MVRTESGHAPVLTLAAGHEFIRVHDEILEPERAQALVDVLDGLHYDAGLLTSAEAEKLRQTGVPAPQGWSAPQHPERRDLRLSDGHVVALLLLPDLPEKLQAAPEALGQAAGRLCRKALAEADLVIALSPWGFMPERSWVDSLHGTGPDILLGSGPGMGLEEMLLAQDRTIWSRASAKGKSVSRLDLFAWPARQPAFAWGKDVSGNIRTQCKALDNDIPEDPTVLTRLAHVAGE